MSKLITIRYGIGYGEHITDIEIEEDATNDRIEEYVEDAILERVWWAWHQEADEA